MTPFYNTQDYLGECIESVLQQGYGNWEYILLNNCSTDKSAEIAEKYASQFRENLRLEHNSVFLSQVQNYNAGLRLISPISRYCKFVQADDRLFPDCTRNMVEVAEAHPTVGIVSAYELEGSEVRLGGLPFSSPEVSGREVCRLYFLKDKYLFGTPTSLLLRSELIRSRDPFYEERLAPFEDGHVCFELLKNCNFGFVHQVLTFSRRDNESSLSSTRSFNFLPLLRLAFVVTHGQHYLGKEEYEECLEEAERNYFSFLARCACARRRWSPEFWEFHRKGLASINYTLDWRLLGKWIPRALLEKAQDTVLNTYDKLFL